MNCKLTNVIWIVALILFSTPVQVVAAKPPTGPVEVTSATPDAVPPATLNTDIRITGVNFDKSAKVFFLKAGTEELGDVVVNASSTSNSSEIVANISVPAGATDQSYDIEVRMSRGRGGKGTTLFKVSQDAPSPVPNNDGNAIPMNCTLNYNDNGSASLKNDSELSALGGPFYFSGIDKVTCQSSGVVSGNLAGLRMISFGPGNPRKAIRFVDMVFENCTDGTRCLPKEFLDASYDTLQLDTRPRPDLPGHDHIHLMPHRDFQQPYQMAFAVWPDGLSDRYKIEMDAGNINGERPLSSHSCHNDMPGYQAGDYVNVYIWEDGIFSGVTDGLADGYTVTTGEVIAPETFEMHPVVSAARAVATVCASVDQQGEGCPSDKARNALCHTRGQVEMEFTLHMQYD